MRLAAVFLFCLVGVAQVREANVGAGEGPAWDGKRYLYFTGKNGISRRDATTGKVEVFRADGGGANGLLFDREGRLIACQAGLRRVVRFEAGGNITVLAAEYQGKPFNSPNDLAIDSRGRIYFSDPRYGDRKGMQVPESVYRIDAPGKVSRILEREVNRPNGLLVSARDEYLFIADNNNDQGGVRQLLRFRLKPDGTVDAASKHVVFDWGASRGPDGIETDGKRLYVAAGRSRPRPPHETAEHKGGIYIFSTAGKLDRVIAIPDDEVTNCAIAGDTLFITAGGNLWHVGVN